MRQKNDQENESSHTEHFNNDENRKGIQNNVEEEITGKYNLRKRENILAPERFVNLAEAFALIAENNEPISFAEAIYSRDRKEWENTMHEELKSHEVNDIRYRINGYTR
ncbi:hypothetical protein JTB14_017090 [Gonioctena quinquepunctata]|nr:hypothetical protein JTB14_017090 [Gonioctena quinquepunctata]